MTDQTHPVAVVKESVIPVNVTSPSSPPEVTMTTLYPHQTTDVPVDQTTPNKGNTFDFLWCQDCGRSYAGNCPSHGSLSKVRDREIPSKAKLTVPHMLSLKSLGLSSEGLNLYSIVAKKIVQKRTMFGPFEAPLSEQEPSSEQENKQIRLKLFDSNGKGLWYDQSNEYNCNWMIFVHTARYVEELNMVAYQYKDKVYFTTTKVIPPNQELKVWYAEDYGNWMEVSSLPKLQGDSGDECMEEEPVEVAVEEDWKCTLCQMNFMTFEELEEHTCPSARPVKEKSRPKRSRKGRPMKRIHGKLVTTRSAAKRKERLTAAAVVAAARKRKALPKIQPLKVPKPVFECMYCSKAICGENAYKLHLSVHTGKKPFVCDFPGCNKGFTSKYKLDRHVLIHTGTKNFKCSYCERSFNRKDHLKIHLAVHDQNRKPNMCDICGKEYSSNITFRTHMAFHAADNGDKVCKICNKDFATKEELIFHIRVHSGSRLAKTPSDKRQNCPYCEKRFFTKKDVKRHLIVHTKKKDYLCQFCPQRFGRKDHLTRHIRATHITNVVKSEDGEVVKKPSGRPAKSKKQAEVTSQATEGLEPQPLPPPPPVVSSPVTNSSVLSNSKVQAVATYQIPLSIPCPSTLPHTMLDPVSVIASGQQVRPHLTPMAVYATGPHVIAAEAPTSMPHPPLLHPGPPPPHSPTQPLPIQGTFTNMPPPMPPQVNQIRPLPPATPDLQHGFNQRLNTLYNNKFCNPPQSFEAMVGYIETLKFLENLPTVGPPPHGHPLPNPPPSPYTSGYLVPPEVHIQRPSPTFPQQQHPLPPPPSPLTQHSQLPQLTQHTQHVTLSQAQPSQTTPHTHAPTQQPPPGPPPPPPPQFQ